MQKKINHQREVFGVENRGDGAVGFHSLRLSVENQN